MASGTWTTTTRIRPKRKESETPAERESPPPPARCQLREGLAYTMDPGQPRDSHLFPLAKMGEFPGFPAFGDGPFFPIRIRVPAAIFGALAPHARRIQS